jgi:hypothetical protein
MIVFIFMLTMTAVSCKKDKKDISDGLKKISDVVKPEWLLTVTDHGMPIYEGKNPPDVTGKFRMSPYRFDYDNYTEPNVYPQPGLIMNDLVIEFKNQNGQNLEAAFGGNYLTGIELKSPIVTGSGNNFTVCFTARVTGGMSALFTYTFAYLFSGRIEGAVIKDMKMARVGLDKAEAGFTVEGQVALYSDVDGTSEKTP